MEVSALIFENSNFEELSYGNQARYGKNSKNPGFFSPAQYIVGLAGNAKNTAIASRIAFRHRFL